MEPIKAWQTFDNSGPDGLSLNAIRMPHPAAGEILVAVEAAALNFSDMLMISGAYQVQPPLPYTPGQEVAGTVIESGPDVTFQPGDRVAGKLICGGFAEQAIVREDMAFAVPQQMKTREAVALPIVYTTAMVALTESTRVKTGETVLIHAAAGGVGLAAVQIAKAFGATVIGTAGDDKKLAVVKEFGADLVLNYRDDDWIGVVRAFNNGRRADIIFDPVGGETTLNSLRCLAREGRLLIVGFASGSVPKIPAHYLLLKRASAIGVYWNHDYDGEMLERVTKRLLVLYAGGKIKPLVRTYEGLAALPQALADLSQRRSIGKLVLAI
jgi:NADPH2:quinone reductase